MTEKSNEEINAELIGAYRSVVKSLPQEMQGDMAPITEIKNRISGNPDQNASVLWQKILGMTRNIMTNNSLDRNHLRPANAAFEIFLATAKRHLGIVTPSISNSSPSK